MGVDEHTKYVEVQSVELEHGDISHERADQRTTTTGVLTKTWPQGPVHLTPNRLERAALILYDLGLVVVPIILIVKIILCIVFWRLDREHVNSAIDAVHPATWMLVELNEQLVTIFTIIFVTIISTLVKRYALYRAQRGAYVSDLEQLQGSVSMTSTLKLVLCLRSWSTQSIVLCLIWCFYYLGSQAAKREFAIANSSYFESLPAASFNFSGPTVFTILEDDAGSLGDPGEGNYATWSSIFSSVNDRLSAFKDGVGLRKESGLIDFSRGSDRTGWALVPDIALAINPDLDIMQRSPGNLSESDVTSQIPKSKAPDRRGWVPVSVQSQNVYTSLIGHPLYTYKPTRNYTDMYKIVGSYDFKTAYLNIGCGVPAKHEYADFPDRMANGTKLPAPTGLDVNMIMNNVTANASKDARGHPLRTFELWIRWSNDSNMLMPDRSPVGPGSIRSACNITSTHVEVSVSCGQLGCVPVRMRYRDPDQAESPSVFKLTNAISAYQATSYSTRFDSKTYANNFLSNFISFAGPAADQYSGTLAEIEAATLPYHFIGYPEGSGWCASCDKIFNDMRASVNPAISYWFNTYAQIGQQFINGRNPDVQVLAKNGSDGTFDPVTLKGAFYKRAYYIYWPWIAIDSASCLILLSAGLLCHWLRVHTLAPDIFGYVSSLTRDNPYLDLPDNGSALSGLDRARLMKKVKVKIGDMNAEKEGDVGKIGLARLDAGGRQVVGLTKGKVYM